MKKTIISLTKNLLFTLGFFFVGAAIVSAAGTWTPPSQTPPNGNVDAPINAGSNGQSKIGGLLLNTGNFEYGLLVNSGKVGIGTLTPTQTLDVVGNIKTSGIMITSGATAGAVLTASDALGNTAWTDLGSAITTPHNTVVLSSGSGNWTVPANVTSIEVHVVGGGAAGMYAGGMGGGYATDIMPVTPGNSIAYSIGSGGTASCNVTASGGNTTFGSITAYGGNGNLSSNTPTFPVPSTAGGWTGGDWGAYGHSWLDSGAHWDNGDKVPGYPSGFPYSRGGGGTTNTTQLAASGNILPIYGGGGNGDTDNVGGYCGSNGAAGVIIIKY